MNNHQNNSGDNSNIINNQIQGSNNTIYSNTQQSQPEMSRVKQEPFKLFNKQVKTWWIHLTAVVAFIANLIAIYVGLSSFKGFKLADPGNTSSNSIVYLQLGVFFILGISIYLSQVFRNSILKIGKFKIANHNGKLYFEDYEADCPKCGAKLRPVTFKRLSFMRCKIYPEHSFRFDPKIFDQESYN